MRSAIICESVHHGNTRRIADAMAEELSARVYTVADAATLDGGTLDCVGIGSGIYFGRHHRQLRDFVDQWPLPAARVFIFSTAGLPFLHFFQHSSLRRRLRKRGCQVIAEFCCRGWDTVGPLWLMGGINRRRPSAADLQRARRFAQGLVT